MVRSMFSGVAGLRAHQTKMDVIGNNIANVNTYGFKSGRVTFKDSFYQTLTGASGASGSSGGGNASQIGYGSQVNSIDVLHTPGSFGPTDDPTDVMINGNGYFMVGPAMSGGYSPNDVSQLQLTRVGIFRFDGSGNLVDPNRNMVYGFKGYSKDDTTIDKNNANAASNLVGKTLTTAKGSVFTVDASGVVTVSKSVGGETANDIMQQVPALFATTCTLGQAATYVDANGTTQTIAAGADLPKGVEITTAVAGNDYKFTINEDGTTNLSTTDLATVGYGTVQGAELIPAHGKLKLAVTDMTRVVPMQIPNAPGTNKAMELKSISIGKDGTITGIGAGDRLITVGRLAVANVPNPNALEMSSSSYYVAKENTGDIVAYAAGSETVGTIESGGLEMANVDLSKEFTEMITTQRGFQANTRIITVSDEMLQELVNLKR